MKTLVAFSLLVVAALADPQWPYTGLTMPGYYGVYPYTTGSWMMPSMIMPKTAMPMPMTKTLKDTEKEKSMDEPSQITATGSLLPLHIIHKRALINTRIATPYVASPYVASPYTYTHTYGNYPYTSHAYVY